MTKKRSEHISEAAWAIHRFKVGCILLIIWIVVGLIALPKW
jgi:uncharacterized membrane protein